MTSVSQPADLQSLSGAQGRPVKLLSLLQTSPDDGSWKRHSNCKSALPSQSRRHPSAPQFLVQRKSSFSAKTNTSHLGGPLSDKQLLMQTALPRELFAWKLWGGGRSLSAKIPCYQVCASCKAIFLTLGRGDHPGTLKGKLLQKPDSSWRRLMYL